jgi:hypothetical protein
MDSILNFLKTAVKNKKPLQNQPAAARRITCRFIMRLLKKPSDNNLALATRYARATLFRMRPPVAAPRQCDKVPRGARRSLRGWSILRVSVAARHYHGEDRPVL